MPAVLSIADLADRGPNLGPMFANGASTGSGETLEFIDLVSGTDFATVRTAARAARSSGGLLVGIARKPVDQELHSLTSVLSLSLTEEESAVRDEVILVSALDDGIKSLDQVVTAHPLASATLCAVLRLGEGLDVEGGLTAESLAYSMLLAGPEFARWLREREATAASEETGDAVLLDRKDNVLHVRLNRPEKHNAYSRALRDGLVDAIGLAIADTTIARVELSGIGPSFCSGGDLHEFGTAPDPVTAHLIRMRQSVARLIHRHADRITVRVHGACIGAGVELPSFASKVVAARDAYFCLPEISMGLIPGAGGTVGLPKRIGRWRTAYLALTGDRLDVARALEWGLVDEVEHS